MTVPSWVLPFVLDLLGEAAEAVVRGRMAHAQTDIVARMTEKGMTLPAVPVNLLARDAMFRLWHVVVLSGDFADRLRDRQEHVVVPRVVALFPPGANLPELVRLTREEVLRATFESGGLHD